MADSQKAYSLEEALRAQQALRNLGGLDAETFPVQAFVGMVSDEIEHLRKQGHTDEEIATTIRTNSAIDITARDIEENYAPAEMRHAAQE